MSPDDYAEWLKTNPPPDLMKLVLRCGGYDKITRQDWIEFDIACTVWEDVRRSRLLGSATWKVWNKK